MPAQRMEAPITIGEAIIAIQRRDYLLPTIQREFVWTAEKTEDLFDSLLRGYPVGSFLFWKVSQENSQKYRFYEFMQSYDAYDNMRLKPYDIAVPKALTVVLDGQQRLTSFTIGLLGYRADRLKHKHANNPNSYPQRRLYLNLAGPLPESKGVDRQYDFRFMSEREVQEAEQGVYWFPVRRVLEFRDGVDVDTGKLVEFTVGEQLNKWGAGTVARLCNSILKSPVVHYFPGRRAGSESRAQHLRAPQLRGPAAIVFGPSVVDCKRPVAEARCTGRHLRFGGRSQRDWGF